MRRINESEWKKSLLVFKQKMETVEEEAKEVVIEYGIKQK